MAKVAFSKLNLKKNTDVRILKWNDLDIEIKQYLPIEDKLNLVSKIINDSVDDNGYYNTARVFIYKVIHITEAYTNISFTEKQKEDVFGLYDKLISSGFWKKLHVNWMYPKDTEDQDVNYIPFDEVDEVFWWVDDIIANIYKYKDSVVGILDTIQSDYNNLNFDSEQIRKNLSDPDNLALLKDTLTKLG